MSKPNKKSQIAIPGDPVNPVVASTDMDKPASRQDRNKQEIADLAYQRWVERGRPQGSPDEDWFEAERELGSHS